MGEAVRIKISPDDKMVEIPIEKEAIWKNRVEVDIIFEIWTNGKTEEEAGKQSEDVADDLVRYLDHQIRFADWIPDPEDVYLATWGVRNLEVEKYEDEEE